MEDSITRAQEEINRLSTNSRLLFDLLPDMLFIIKDDTTIERMNKAALARFGSREGGRCHEVIFGEKDPCDAARCPFRRDGDAKPFGKVFEKKISEDLYAEYSYVPFEGYQKDNLTLLVLRDITQKKRQELELREYNENIERVLKEKIRDLENRENEREALYSEINHLKKAVQRSASEDEKMLGESPPMRTVRETVYRVAPSNATILITGESGTGKELVADMIYGYSNRVGKPYIKFNCSAVNENLLESDLFGYEKGAFTGANTTRKGKFEEADGGTIFLDEVGNITPKMQSGLLRVLQEGEIVRVGATHPISVDVRVIAATNTELEKAVEKGEFREDLYYRLKVISLHQPPLRDRKEDIPLLATNFLVKYRERFGKDVTLLPNAVINALLEHHWPGNVRELENTIQRAVLLARNGMISREDLEISPGNKEADADAGSGGIEAYKDLPLKESLSKIEAALIEAALRENTGTIESVCERLGVGRTTLYEKMKRHGIRLEDMKNNAGAESDRSG